MAITPHPALSAGSAAVVNRLLTKFRTSSCVIERPSTGKDATGAPVSGFTPEAPVPCKVRSLGLQPLESVGGSRFAPVVAYEVRFEPDVEIRSTDRIQVNGRTLEVIGDNDASTSGFELVVITKAVAA